MAKPEVLLAHLDAFVGFVRRRVGDPDLAADVVQDALAKALARIDQVDDDERVVAWFYRILRNAIIDLRRHRASDPVEHGTAAPDPGDRPEDLAEACRCLLPLIGQLAPDTAHAVRAVDLDGRSLADVAREQGISVGNLKVRRLRARHDLREMLAVTCRMCAKHGCVDCTCRR